ncbi:MAG: tyrosine-type recombinase/integrase [Acidobacteriota bacterium]|nr:tyrosine-type recombinase/integrase [Acidobacteriota bacterium]
MTVKLTAKAVETLPAVPGKRMEYFDAAVPGLALRVTPTGARSWSVLYRHRGRLRRMTLGTLDLVSLADARQRARDLLYAAGKGDDPAAAKQDAKHAKTVGELVEIYIEKHAKPKKRSWKADDRNLRLKVLPTWRHRAIADITRQDVRALVDDIAEGGAPILANRIASLLSKLFAFALDRDLVTASPAVKIPRPGTEQQRDRVYTDGELRALWAAWEGLEPRMGAFYTLRLLTAQRGGEVAAMRWQDVDLASGWWTIPATGSKNGLAHRVPLSPSVVALLTTLQPEDLTASAYVLDGARSKRLQARAAATFTVPGFHGHDLRRTAASRMASGGVDRLTIAKILNHVDSSVTAVYDRHSYDPEKAAALAWWDAKLAALVENKGPGTVLAFQKARGLSDATHR